MKFYELRQNVIDEFNDRDSLENHTYEFQEGFRAALQALSGVMENDDYVNWDDILDTLKSRLGDDILCEMFNPEDVL